MGSSSDYFAQLSQSQKAELFNIYTKGGFTNLSDIVSHYNSGVSSIANMVPPVSKEAGYGFVLPDTIYDISGRVLATGGPKKNNNDDYNVFEDPRAVGPRKTHRASLDAFIKKNPTLYGLNTAEFADILSDFAGLESTYNRNAKRENGKYGGYYGLENASGLPDDKQHNMAYEHMAELFKNNIITKDDLERGLRRGYGRAEILYKYWNQENNATELIWNDIAKTIGDNPDIRILGNKIKSDVDYGKYLNDAYTEPFYVVKKGDSFSRIQQRTRYPGRHYDVAGKDLHQYNKKFVGTYKKNGKLVEEIRDLHPDDTLWNTDRRNVDLQKYNTASRELSHEETTTPASSEKESTSGWLYTPSNIIKFAKWYNKRFGSMFNRDRQKSGWFNRFDDGGPTDDEPPYYGGTLTPSIVRQTLPDIRTKEGVRIAKNMAQRIASGQMDWSGVPDKYHSYVQGEVKGAMPLRDPNGMRERFASKYLMPAVTSLAFGPTGAISVLAGEAVNLGVNAASGGKNKTWGQLFTGNPTWQTVWDFTNPGYLLAGPLESGTKSAATNVGTAMLRGTEKKFFKDALRSWDRSIANSKLISPSVAQPYVDAIASVPELLKTPQTLVTPKLPKYEIEDLGGGYMLKSLMRNNALEKQLSKQGTVNVNNIKALINKGSKVEQAVVDKVLASEEFAGKKAIDYNKFRKAVQNELITYERTPDARYENYGFESIGGEFADPAGLSIAGWKDKLDTYTFSSPRIPQGSGKHYDQNTLGHSRTYTRADEPDVLHVMESQSDWAQSKAPTIGSATRVSRGVNGNTDIIYDRTSGRYSRVAVGEGMPEGEFFHDIGSDGLTHYSRFTTQSRKEFPLEQADYLKDNFTSRQIQENLRYAAEKGQTKMRYPTRETAAKIEGYQGREAYFDADWDEVTKAQAYVRSEATEKRLVEIAKELAEITDRMLSLEDSSADGKRFIDLAAEAQRLKAEEPHLRQGITKKIVYEHEDVLKHYSGFPKQYKKLFKGADVRTITDAKGNTWYEVDVPENYLKQEWVYKTGGPLSGLKKFL